MPSVDRLADVFYQKGGAGQDPVKKHGHDRPGHLRPALLRHPQLFQPGVPGGGGLHSRPVPGGAFPCPSRTMMTKGVISC